jgi:tetratricopeptide (TPR) repeat protein/tRNA A-37 threonylcarbamoyl transferase component Bud32
MDDAKRKKAGPEGATVGGPSGLRTPVKGESSGGDISLPDDAKIVDPALSAPPSPANAPAGDVTYVGPSPSPNPARPRDSSIAARRDHLRPGDVLGGRYEILNLLGEGGMGAVYKARDLEVDHLVALKVIRPEMADHPVILARFKQELLTARQVTHHNAIRIYDLSEVDGIKFITMEFVEGCDLRKLLLDNGKLSPEQAVDTIRQVLFALEAAHRAGVIHRDLKPQNIMQEKTGRILVMDFGLARSLGSDGMTQSGALLGTIEYMSPEQAMGKHLDARSDLFTVGLIFYELLTGRIPYKADTAMASLLKRNQERALPAAEIDASVPKGLSDIVSKCLERDLELRYQSAKEILADLDAWEGKRPIAASVVIPARLPPRAVPWKWVAAGTLAAAIAIAGWALKGKLASTTTGKTPAGPEVSLAILPFRNGSGDAKLDWLGSSLADMLSTDVGQSAHLRTISPGRLNQVLSDLQISPGTDIDPATMGRIAEFSNADTIVSGQYARFGDQIRIDATLRDLKHQRTDTLKAEAANEKELLPAIAQLAGSIQQHLSLSSDVLSDLRAKSFQPSSSSLPALRSYNEGMELERQGNHLEAAKRFQSSVQADPNFALAFSRLGQTYSNLRNDDKAKEYSQKAVDLSEKLPPPERYLIQANYAQVTNDFRKAIESYENLEKVSPEDADVRFHLGELYESTGTYDKARTELAKVLSIDPKHVDALLAAGRVEIRSNNPKGSLDYLNRALTLAVQLDNTDGKASILNAIGNAYEQLDKPQEALRNFQESLAIKQSLGQKPGVAQTLANIARVQATLGKPDDANKSYQQAVKLQREIGDKKGLGSTLVNLGALYSERGKYDDALNIYKEALQIQRDLGNESYQAVCLNNIGDTYLSKGQPSDALTYYERALELRKKANIPSEVGETLHNLGEASLKAGDYGQSLDYHMKALDLFRSSADKSGAAIQSYSIGTIFEYQGRYGAALKSKEEALKTFRELNDRSFWMGEILSGYGNSLSEVGRYDEAQKNLTEAMSLAKELQNKTLIAQILNFQGDTFYYRGDIKAASDLFAQAIAASSADVEKDVVLLSKYNAAKCVVEEKRYQAAVAPLKAVVAEADAVGLKNISTEATLALADALLNTRQYPAAKKELETAQATSEKLGLLVLQARSQYLLARTLVLSGNTADAPPHFAAAKRLLESIRQESGSDAILKRQDLSAIAAQSPGNP